MTAVVIAALALAGALVGGFLYVLHLLASERSTSGDLSKSLREVTAAKAQQDLDMAAIRSINSDLNRALSDKEVALIGEADARKRLEAYRDELLDELTKAGDPRGVATRINAELRAIAKLSARPDSPSPKDGNGK